MKWLFPYPVLFAALLLFWLLLNDFTIGALIFGSIVAFVACHAMTALVPQKPRIRSYRLIPVLVWRVALDILQSNIAVTKIILSRHDRGRRAGFVAIPLQLTDRMGLAILACIITATPGTAWVDYHAASGELLIHVLDLKDAQEWRDSIKQRYEELLLEIFA
ncbi:multicomponent K+:H+ antiporter subunit E [Paenochrobactrum gallinarii]|uniref:Multicomponent K+:H+ antiporter subunit E n=1 Tax=Paenochrobactrum gallinarii TaxID=643673 RepID=A0A841M3N4_9HYPH|nr:Na+/H+ antiporter subunit E [Paenochrobactrum gallinarii]MBB6260758.1 multicomponent K+:H+ antiporter subunit E [Paenochrobactrum gallinarii]